jgi:hypothetical protein
LTRAGISIFQDGLSSGGQFQNVNDKLPNPKGGLQTHSVIEGELPHRGQQSNPALD